MKNDALQMVDIPLGYRHVSAFATDWCVVDYYIIPEAFRFTVSWEYGGSWSDRLYSIPKTIVEQTAHYVKIVRRREDLSFFDFEILEEDFTTIRGKNCKGVQQYLKIYRDFVQN